MTIGFSPFFVFFFVCVGLVCSLFFWCGFFFVVVFVLFFCFSFCSHGLVELERKHTVSWEKNTVNIPYLCPHHSRKSV